MHKRVLPLVLILLGISCEKGSEAANDEAFTQPVVRQSDSREISDVQQREFSDLDSPMDEAKFWQIIEQSPEDLGTEERLIDIQEKLMKLTLNEVLSFDVRMHMLLYSSYSSKLMCAGELLHHNCPNFNFEEFRCWIILHGKDAFYNAKSNPNSLIQHFGPEENCYSSAELHLLASRVLKEVHERDLAQLIDPVKFPYYKSNYPKLTLDWSIDRPQSMRAICPQLFDACWH